MAQGTRSVRLFITGTVQGVGFRYWCVSQATRLGLDGWVRNLKDGSVEAVASGSEDAVDDLVEACRHGPNGAKVEGVFVSDADPTEAGMPGFSQYPTV